MTDDLIEISKRAVACKGWRWMPGMLARSEFRTIRIEHYGVEGATTHDKLDAERKCQYLAAIPDLTDPATLGCLLALVREAWGGDFEQVWLEWYPPLSRWGIQGGHAGTRSVLLASGPTEAEALVAALEGAP